MATKRRRLREVQDELVVAKECVSEAKRRVLEAKRRVDGLLEEKSGIERTVFWKIAEGGRRCFVVGDCEEGPRFPCINSFVFPVTLSFKLTFPSIGRSKYADERDDRTEDARFEDGSLRLDIPSDWSDYDVFVPEPLVTAAGDSAAIWTFVKDCYLDDPALKDNVSQYFDAATIATDNYSCVEYDCGD